MGWPIARDKYELARQLIADGSWVVHATGVVTGFRGDEIGYSSDDEFVRLGISDLGRIRTVYRGRVIVEHAHGPIPPGYEVTHKNGRRSDDRLENLVVTEPKANVARRLRRGNQS
jgi:hypothetical protein